MRSCVVRLPMLSVLIAGVLAVALASCSSGSGGSTAATPTAPTPAPGPAPDTRFTLSGSVTETTATGSVGVADVTVTIIDGPNAGITTLTRSRLQGVTTTTNSAGFYQLTNLAGGGFTVRFEKNGYGTVHRGVDLRSNVTENVELTALAPPGPSVPTARYRVSFEAYWGAQTHPQDIPSNPHFSRLIGATHGPGVAFWAPGAPASPGIQIMAETGRTSPLDSEIAAAQAAGLAETLISGGGLAQSPGVVTAEFEISQGFPLVTLVTMVAPSPDWFVGVHDVSLLNGDWRDEVVIELFPYDAGTDSGTTYGSADEVTVPQGVIMRLEGAPVAVGGTVPPFGRFIFRRTR